MAKTHSMSARAAAWTLATLACACAHAQPAARANFLGDPFGQVTSGMPGCPPPEGPLVTAEEARLETHWRAERGTSCFRSGRCRLPNGYRYDKEIYPRAIQFLHQDGRFGNTSIWITVQRRWVIAQGCVTDAAQGAQLEAALRQIDDVESVIGQWMVGTGGKPPYAVAAPQPARP